MKRETEDLSRFQRKNWKNPKTLDKHTAKFIAVLIENLPRIPIDSMDRWIKNPKSLQRVLFKSLCPQEDKQLFSGNDYLKLISGNQPLIVSGCDDKIIEKADDMFAYVNSDFINYKANEKHSATPDTPFGVYELQKDSTFKEFFTSVTPNLDSMCFTHGQIREIVKNNRSWLRTEGYGNFFLLKSNNSFFVAHVYFRTDGGAGVSVRRFEYDLVWGAGSRHRVFLPALAV